MSEVASSKTWLETIAAFKHPRVITMLFFGISAGLPILLIFSSLSLWLREAGIERSAVTYFSWAALGYSFKFIWAPLVDKLPLPVLTARLGRRRSWLLLSQVMIAVAIIMMAMVDPAKNTLTMMAIAAVLLGFSSATQDIVIDAYRIESAESDLQALMSSTYIAGYRIGMLLAGAGALFLASYFGSTSDSYSYQAWQISYLIMASLMLIGMMTTLIVDEPKQQFQQITHNYQEYLSLFLVFIISVAAFIVTYWFGGFYFIVSELPNVLAMMMDSHLGGFILEMLRLFVAIAAAGIVAKLISVTGIVKQELIVESYVDPVRDFFQRYGWSLAWLLLALIGLYRISDIVLGVIANVFYQDLGFTKIEIATVVKSFGLVMTIAGGFLGGLLAVRFGVLRILFLGALLSALTNLLFMLLAQMGHDMTMLYIVISADNLSAGLASAAFIAFLSSLTNISFTAVQYALFSSLMTLLPKVLGGYSGTMVDTMGYQQFFLITALIGVPVLILIVFAGKRFKLNKVVIKT